MSFNYFYQPWYSQKLEMISKKLNIIMFTFKLVMFLGIGQFSGAMFVVTSLLIHQVMSLL